MVSSASTTLWYNLHHSVTLCVVNLTILQGWNASSTITTVVYIGLAPVSGFLRILLYVCYPMGAYNLKVCCLRVSRVFREITKSEFIVLLNWTKKMFKIITGDRRNQRIGSVAFVSGAGHPKRIVIYKVMILNRYWKVQQKKPGLFLNFCNKQATDL